MRNLSTLLTDLLYNNHCTLNIGLIYFHNFYYSQTIQFQSVDLETSKKRINPFNTGVAPSLQRMEISEESARRV